MNNIGEHWQTEEERWSLMGSDRWDARMPQDSEVRKVQGGQNRRALELLLVEKHENILRHDQGCGWGSDDIKSGLSRREAQGREVVKIVDVRDDKDLALEFRRRH